MLTLTHTLDRNADWPVAWYTLGLIEQKMWDRHFVVKATPYHAAGVSYRRGAMEAFARALKADASFLPASAALADLIVELGHRKLAAEFLPPLQRSATTPGVDPAVFLAIARLQESRRDYPATLAAQDQYLTAGGDAGVAGVERSRTLEALGRTNEGVEAYTTGLVHLTAAGRAAYIEDLGWVAHPEELTELDSLPPDSAATWIARFWRERDALELRAPGDRLREHLRRWVYAHQNFLIRRPDDAPIHSEGQRYEDQEGIFDRLDPYIAIVLVDVALTNTGWTLYQRQQWEVDDRGAIYIRHGEPTKKVSAVNSPPNESWLYVRPTGRPIFHFLGSHALGTTAATTLVASLPLTPEMLDSRGELDPRYTALGIEIEGRALGLRNWHQRHPNIPELNAAIAEIAAGRRHSAKTIALASMVGSGALSSTSMDATPGSINLPTYKVTDEIARGRSAVTDAMATDTYPLTFARELGAAIQLYGLGFAEGEARRVLTAFAVRGEQITPTLREDGGPGLLYPVSLRIIAMDRAGGTVRQLDTTRLFVAMDSLRKGQYLTGMVELTVPPGTYQVRALISTRERDVGAAVGRDDLALLPAAGVLVLSDVILGREGQLTWSYHGNRIPLNPLDAFPRNSDATLFHEIAGLVPGGTYQVSIAVRRSQDKPTAAPLIAISFPFNAETAYYAVQRSIGLTQLKPGAYALTVTVREDGTERVVSRSRGLNVLK